MIFYTAKAIYYAKTSDNRFHKLGSHKYCLTQWLSGAWEVESSSEFSSHKGVFFKDNFGSSTEGEYLPEFTEEELSAFLRNGDNQEIRKVLSWSGLLPEQINAFYLYREGEDAGFPSDPTWLEITAQETLELETDENGNLLASLPDELL